MGTTSIYPRDVDKVVCRDGSVLQVGRTQDSQKKVPADLPCNVIVVHGVNDVGTSYHHVEQGICKGLAGRLQADAFQPGTYHMPTPADARELHPDPDAVFYKRALPKGHRTPVIPFYWGFRERDKKYKDGSETRHGQALDRYGNRLDKDYSKGGGPFVNATTSLPDMWGPGKSGGSGTANRIVGDALRPLLGSPGRMYMILAARRLAALVSMIRDWHADDVVNIVAHSQGCMLSLLAQAFLMEDGLRPADTLVLTHPPYSLVDDFPWLADASDSEGDADERMKGSTHLLRGGQTFHARLTTLANIVQGVAAKRHGSPTFSDLGAPRHRGMVGAKWVPDAPERDNRGKVYLYFCPEDTTVELDNVLGIGWQGVPNVQTGSRLERQPGPANVVARSTVTRRPLDELGPRFFQRVFTGRKRPDAAKGRAVMVGQAPHDFALRVKGESGFEHVDGMKAWNAGRWMRTAPSVARPEHAAGDAANPQSPLAESESGHSVRRITGEPLRRPVEADMLAGAVAPDQRPQKLKGAPPGAYESVDPIDAAIASTQDFGYEFTWDVVDDPGPSGIRPNPVQTAGVPHGPIRSPSSKFDGLVRLAPHKTEAVLSAINLGKKPPQSCRRIKDVYVCLAGSYPGMPSGKLLIQREETPDEARLRWQQQVAQRSFHNAIFGSADNHCNVTAHDLAIGGGRASSDANFSGIFARWQIGVTQMPQQNEAGILKWADFSGHMRGYLCVEPPWRKDLIEGNAAYYSNGVLPKFLPRCLKVCLGLSSAKQ